MGNQIAQHQNEADRIRLMRARARTYDLAELLMYLQLSLTVVIPVAGSILSLFVPEAKAYVAAFSLVVLVLDVVVLDRWQKALLKRAARLGERFDCDVLELSWDSFVVGEEVELEEVLRLANSYSGDEEKLKNWYPVAAAEVPIHLGRIICQRTNLRYDSQLRRNYSTLLGIAVGALFAVLLVAGLIRNQTLIDWVLQLTPLTPILSWSVREFYRQRDAAEQLEQLLKAASKLWADATSGGIDDAACKIRSREFQGAIYAKRVQNPLIPPFVYRSARSRLEKEMNAAAVEYVRGYQQGS
jgi:hypothetical protein